MSFLHAKYIHSISTTPKVLTHASLNSKLRSLTSISSTSDMGETHGIIHPEVNFLSSCEHTEPSKLCASKVQWWDTPRIDIPIPKGRHREGGWGDGSQASSKPREANSRRSLSSRIIFSGIIFCLLDPLVCQRHAYSLAGCCSCLVVCRGPAHPIAHGSRQPASMVSVGGHLPC